MFSHDLEFYKQVVLKQIPNCLLFYTADTNIQELLVPFMHLPGDDPLKDSKSILFRWSVLSIMNRFVKVKNRPDFPLDFSNSHPAFIDYFQLVQYARDFPDKLINLSESFPFEFFKALQNMKSEFSQDFGLAVSLNGIYDLHTVGRFISYFSISDNQLNFADLLLARCHNVNSIASFYEGLLCNIESRQLEMAQLLSAHTDPFLGEEAIQLANTTIRTFSHFVDNSGALSRKVFPLYSIINFLIQADSMNMKEMFKQLKNIPDHVIKTKFLNQITIASICGVGNDWSVFSQKSVPSIITPELFNKELLCDIPRDSSFIVIQDYEWIRDYDFIYSFIAVKYMLIREVIDFPIPKLVNPELFSLLFLQKDGHYIFSIDYAELLLKKLIQNNDESNKNLFEYIERALFKIRLVRLCFENPKFDDLLLSEFQIAQSIPTHLIETFSDVESLPSFIYSIILQKAVQRTITCDKSSNQGSLIFIPRIPCDKDKDLGLLTVIRDLSKIVPKKYRDNSILDLVCSNASLTYCAPLTLSNPNLLEKLYSVQKSFPVVVPLNPFDKDSYIQESLGIIASNSPPKTHIYSFCTFLLQMIASSSLPLEKIDSNQFFRQYILDSQSLLATINLFRTSFIDIESYIFSNFSFEDFSLDQISSLNIHDSLPTLAMMFCSSSFHYSSFSDYPNAMISRMFIYPQSRNNNGFDFFLKTGDIFYIEHNDDLNKNIPSLLKLLLTFEKKQAMNILDDLLLQFNLEDYIEDVFCLLDIFPKEFATKFLETFLVLLPSNSMNIIPVSKRLEKYKPFSLNHNNTDEEIVQSNWNHLMKLAMQHTIVLTKPEHLYRLSIVHLSHHTIGADYVRIFKAFLQILIYSRSAKCFTDDISELEWICEPKNNQIADVLRSLNERYLLDLIIGLLVRFGDDMVHSMIGCFSQEMIMDSLSSYLFENPHLIRLVENQSDQEFILFSTLSQTQISSIADENALSRFLRKTERYMSIHDSPLFRLFKGISSIPFYARFSISYSGNQLGKLLIDCYNLDIHEIIPLFSLLKVSMSEKNKENSMSKMQFFGLLSSDCTNPTTIFRIENIDVFPSFPRSFCTPQKIGQYYCVQFCQKSLLFGRVESQSDFKQQFPPDFAFHNTNSIPMLIKEPLAFGNFLSYKSVTLTNSDKLIGSHIVSADRFFMLDQAIKSGTLLELLESAYTSSNFDFLKWTLEIFDQNSCISALLYFITWSINKEDVMIKCRIGEFDNKSTNRIEIGLLLQRLLIGANFLKNHINPSLIYPPGSTFMNKQTLEDMYLVIDHQIQIGVTTLSLFNSSSDKGFAVKRLLISSDYDRAFGIARILHIDINDIMIDSAAYFGQQSNQQLGDFLLNVIPRLGVESANSLIEALASILVGNKFEELFIHRLISGVTEPRNVYMILRWFGMNESAALVALQNNLTKEIEAMYKEAKKKKILNIQKSCGCWLKSRGIFHN